MKLNRNNSSDRRFKYAYDKHPETPTAVSSMNPLENEENTAICNSMSGCNSLLLSSMPLEENIAMFKATAKIAQHVSNDANSLFSFLDSDLPATTSSMPTTGLFHIKDHNEPLCLNDNRFSETGFENNTASSNVFETLDEILQWDLEPTPIEQMIR